MENNKKISVYVLSFWILIVFSLFSFLNVFKSYPYYTNVKNLTSPNEKITANIAFKSNINSNFLICFNDYCESPEADLFFGIYSIRFGYENPAFRQNKVKEYSLAYTGDEFLDNIENIDFHVGYKDYYFSKDDISKFKKKKIKIELTDSTKEYDALILPVKPNYTGTFNHVCTFILSLFYNGFSYIFCWIGLIFAYLIYQFNKKDFNFSINKNFYWAVFTGIMILGVILRINQINYHPLWLDEIYTKTSAIIDFSSCFKDAGNPPFFYILEFITSKIFNTSTTALRFLPFMFGSLSIFAIFLLFREYSKNFALLASLLTALNTIIIYHSQEARVYGLAIFLNIFITYLLFKYLKNPSDKNLILYSVFSIVAVNSHYYLILFTISNFIWGIVDLLEGKKELKKFALANILIFLTVIPYFIITFKTSLNGSFNSWIGSLSEEGFIYIINEYFNNKIIFILFSSLIVIFLIIGFFKNVKFIDKNKENLFIYLVYTILFILVASGIISEVVKPILHKRLLLSCYGLFLMLQMSLLLTIFKFENLSKYQSAIKGIYSIILICLYFSITNPMPLREIYSLDSYMNFIEADSKINKDRFEIHAYINDSINYINNFPKIKELDYINWHIVDTNSNNYLKKINKKDLNTKKDSIVYLNDINSDISKISQLNPFAKVYKTNTIRNLKIKYEEIK